LALIRAVNPVETDAFLMRVVQNVDGIPVEVENNGASTPVR